MSKLMMWDSPVLKKTSLPVKDGESVKKLIKEMKKISFDNNGAGLAAVQIGVLKRVVIVRSKALINPEIVAKTEKMTTMKEGCLSFPEIFVEVERPSEVKVKYRNIKGKEVTELFSGFHSAVVQHEIDHINGICKVGDEWRRTRDE